jgi:hypothetical protein
MGAPSSSPYRATSTPSTEQRLQEGASYPQIKQQHGDICRRQGDWAGGDGQVEFRRVQQGGDTDPQ